MEKVIVRYNIYDYEELSQEAKNNAYCEFTNNEDFWQSCDFVESMKAFAEAMSCKVTNYSLSESNSYIKFTYPTFARSSDEEPTGRKLWKYLLNNEYFDSLFPERKVYYKTNKEVSSLPYSKSVIKYLQKEGYKYRISKVNYCENSCPFTGMYIDEVLLDELKAFYKGGGITYKANSYFDEIIDSCFDEFLKTYQSEIRYFYSEKNFIENYTPSMKFLESGKEVTFEYEAE